MTYRDTQYFFGKISTSLTNKIPIQRTNRIFDTSYDLLNWPHLHWAYVISGCIFFWLAVSTRICKRLRVAIKFVNCANSVCDWHFLTQKQEARYINPFEALSRLWWWSALGNSITKKPLGQKKYAISLSWQVKSKAIHDKQF